jgi:hypothetical protein
LTSAAPGDEVGPTAGSGGHHGRDRRRCAHDTRATDHRRARRVEAEHAALEAGDITGLYHLGADPHLIRRVFRRRFAI